MSRLGAAQRAAVPAAGAPSPAAAPKSNARAEASRRNGANSRGPKTLEGKARSAQNALKHGLRAQKYVVLPDEDAGEFAALEAALFEELAPVGALQVLLARRVAVAAWRLERADRIETELFAEQRWNGGDLGLALIRDGNGTRSFEVLMRYRGAAMAEFTRALRTLKALQAEQAAGAREVPACRLAAPVSRGGESNEPKRGGPRQLGYAVSDPSSPGPALHEPAAPWLPNQPETEPRTAARHIGARVPNEPDAARNRSEMSGEPAGDRASAA